MNTTKKYKNVNKYHNTKFLNLGVNQSDLINHIIQKIFLVKKKKNSKTNNDILIFDCLIFAV
jgi:hypothetical protein